MIEVFQWVGSLGFVWGMILFIIVCLLLALIPYIPTIFRIIKIWRSKEKPDIIAFEYALTRDHYMGLLGNREMYLLASNGGYLLQGGKLLLTWKVSGAYRVDIKGVGNNLKGNAAWIIVDRKKTKYTLIAHTLKGKRKARIDLAELEIYDITTTQFTNNEEWGFNSSVSIPLTNPLLGNRAQLTQQYPNISITLPDFGSLYPNLAKLDYIAPFGGVVRESELLQYIEKNEIVKMYCYDKNVFFEDGNHLYFSRKNKIREKLRNQ
jgi:hypothetical protein